MAATITVMGLYLPLLWLGQLNMVKITTTVLVTSFLWRMHLETCTFFLWICASLVITLIRHDHKHFSWRLAWVHKHLISAIPYQPPPLVRPGNVPGPLPNSWNSFWKHWQRTWPIPWIEFKTGLYRSHICLTKPVQGCRSICFGGVAHISCKHFSRKNIWGMMNSRRAGYTPVSSWLEAITIHSSTKPFPGSNKQSTKSGLSIAVLPRLHVSTGEQQLSAHTHTHTHQPVLQVAGHGCGWRAKHHAGPNIMLLAV